mmetsp:Transcript_764/g.2157  ORF Transcript_764/g.2157 Transcript_764/m.2157 type:complete len:341 (+) Transcript_764:149-1171(+)
MAIQNQSQMTSREYLRQFLAGACNSCSDEAQSSASNSKPNLSRKSCGSGTTSLSVTACKKSVPLKEQIPIQDPMREGTKKMALSIFVFKKNMSSWRPTMLVKNKVPLSSMSKVAFKNALSVNNFWATSVWNFTNTLSGLVFISSQSRLASHILSTGCGSETGNPSPRRTKAFVKFCRGSAFGSRVLIGNHARIPGRHRPPRKLGVSSPCASLSAMYARTAPAVTAINTSFTVAPKRFLTRFTTSSERLLRATALFALRYLAELTFIGEGQSAGPTGRKIAEKIPPTKTQKFLDMVKGLKLVSNAFMPPPFFRRDRSVSTASDGSAHSKKRRSIATPSQLQ